VVEDAAGEVGILTARASEVIASSTPEQAAATLRTRASETLTVLQNARDTCADAMPECPMGADGVITQLSEQLESVESLADSLLGVSTSEVAPPKSISLIDC